MFKNAVLTESPDIGAGEVLKSKPYVTEAWAHVSDQGIVGGRLVQAKLENVGGADRVRFGSLIAGETPQIVGVCSRRIASEAELGGYFTVSNETMAEVHIYGFMTVEVDPAVDEELMRYQPVYGVTTEGETLGCATNDTTAAAFPDAIFWEHKQPGVWMIAVTKINNTELFAAAE